MRGLVLAGGGSHGTYEVGVLKRWILEEGRDYEILCGISVGALNTAILSQFKLGLSAQAYSKLSDVWDRVSTSKVRKWWFGWYLASLWKSSIYNSGPLEAWVRQELDEEAIRLSGKQLRIGAVSWESGRYKVVDQTSSHLPEWVLASASFPVFFKPIMIDGEEWADGGLRNIAPLGEAIRAGATEIDVVLTGPGEAGKWPTRSKKVAARACRALEIVMSEILEGDLKEAGLKNDLAKLSGKYKDVSIRVCRPSQPIEVDSLTFDPEAISHMRELGYKNAYDQSDEQILMYPTT